jgi:hypothetical protein
MFENVNGKSGTNEEDQAIQEILFSLLHVRLL